MVHSLTYKSPTLSQLLDDSKIFAWIPDLGPRRNSKRRLYVTREFEEWANSLGTNRQQHTLLEAATELHAVAADFVAGEKIVTFIRRVDPPKAQGLLRINTNSLRLVGWCPEPQALILAMGGMAKDLHGPGKKLTLLGQSVVEIRRKLGVTKWEKGEFYELFRFEN